MSTTVMAQNSNDTGRLEERRSDLTMKPSIQSCVLRIMSDGEWRTAEQILSSIRESVPAVSLQMAKTAISCLMRRPPQGREIVSKRVAGARVCQYRLREADAGQIPARLLADFIEQFPTLLCELEDWSNKGQYEIVPSSLQGIAVRMKRLFVALKLSITA